jgi:hypothetical protein
MLCNLKRDNLSLNFSIKPLKLYYHIHKKLLYTVYIAKSDKIKLIYFSTCTVKSHNKTDLAKLRFTDPPRFSACNLL